MTEPRGLWPELVLAVHERQLAEHGGGSGIRAQDMLDSALMRPQQKWAYGQPPPDLPALAAAYAFGIARNHPFVDGNKRTAWVALRLMLKLNGCDLQAPQIDKLRTMLALAAGELSEEALTEWVRSHAQEV
ncbi:MAG: death-on-curing protein [Verrucomicrobiota bacterium]|jgi:death-on-curing protein